MPRIFCIGDIHGCSATLDALLTSEICLKKSDKIIFLGDYIDRGYDSKGVVDIILDLDAKNYDVTCLMGNHEEMFIESHEDDDIYEHWVLKCGGDVTLSSFNILTYEELSESYKYFFNTLLHFKTLKNKYIMVHAGINFSHSNIFEDRYTMLWGRNTSINHDIIKDRKIIHGHTPQTLLKTIEQLQKISEEKIINLDTGCVFSDSEGLGYLTALELNSMQLYSNANVDF